MNSLASASASASAHPAIWRQIIWNDTSKNGGKYPFSTTVKHTYDPKYKLIPTSTTVTTTIDVRNEDTIVAGKKLKDAGYNPVLLNMTDNMHAGGSVDVGSGAQEESLWRRTNLYCTQTDDFYPLQDTPVQEGLYTSAATVFKDTEKNRCSMLVTPFQAAFVAVPGLRNPILQANRKLSKVDRDRLIKKIELIFQIAHRHGHDSIVLGALGCGAWRNPPRRSCRCF